MSARTQSLSSAPAGRQAYTPAELVRRLLALAWQFRADCLFSIVLSLLLLLLALFGLQLLGTVIDVIRYAADPSNRPPEYPLAWAPPREWSAISVVTALSVAIIAQAAVRAWLTYVYNMVTARLTQAKIVPALRDRVYDRLQRLGFRFHDAHGGSSLFNRVTGDVQSTRLFVDGVVLQGINMFLTLVLYLIFMWRIHPGLTGACLSTTLLLGWVTHYYSNRLRPAYLRNRELYDNLVLVFSESVRGMQTVKGFAAEGVRARNFAAANDEVSRQQNRIFLDLSLFAPATQLLSQLSLVILFVYGGWLYVQGAVPLGSGLVVFAGLLQQFNGQVANVTTIANSVQQSFTAAKRVFEVLDAPLEVETRPGAAKTGRLKGEIIFDRVSFGYTPETPVLREISFRAAPGQLIGVFGMTGSGKSTLLSLIPRFYDPRQGRILADGRDIRDVDLDEYRRQIGIVYQESFLFSNTVAANIAFGNPHASQADIEQAAKIASAHEFIQAMPYGYDTVLGEAGVDLSGGERQRLALARALLLQPPVLILDDPAASVDPRTEQEIAGALRQATTGRTTFIVANRLSLLKWADQVLVLDAGRLVQTGTHTGLLRQPGPYQAAAELQFMLAPEQEQGNLGRASAEVGTAAGPWHHIPAPRRETSNP